ncbi:TPA: organic hydroperoxide resistance protein [Legionella pneumophila]|uniref:Organic hydroperoxide resistance protein OsmC, predicted redox protein, regulator of sulfide bond formation n=3 Tax=Legionella pneumophila TaxID=446 RepID=Q5ZU37_LEGPH|nr:organic hydroperoxide resistance protein [Legionella pneumophila]WBV64071.1 organic hydroperoxide resistance protein [Legionella pneumophila 130b]AAU28040.1 organic hydroperoxide resistance protein OsmC, predicted redox protein, regulator of sulfide bond formation [Legionella pneumophila subsp. pneumophila str. Philadelphia 1]AEW52163.1 organic hydroperoxide resistance protein OsmC, predicted redox protein, regulator of sulfide bond formation [Legionella pneumophila subsp. pneumophila ATCC 43
MKALYTTIAKAHGGRNGHVETTDGLLKLDLAMPRELGGEGGATNPEQLFAAGYAACFESAIRHVANVQKISLEDVSMTSEVSLYATPEKGFKLGVALHAHITGLNQNEAEALVAKAHEVCPYSNAIRGNVDVKLSVSVK